MNDKECTFKLVLSTSCKNSEDIITMSSNWLKLKNEKISVLYYVIFNMLYT